MYLHVSMYARFKCCSMLSSDLFTDSSTISRSLVEQAAAAAESLKEQAISMHGAAAVFRLPARAPQLSVGRKRPPALAAPQKKRPKEPIDMQKKARLPARLDDEWEEF